MRIFFTLMITLLFASANGQTTKVQEQINYTEESSAFKKQRFLDTYDYIFLTREPTKSLWKFDLSGFSLNGISINRYFKYVGIRWSNQIQVEYERKINNHFSINGGVSHGTFIRFTGSTGMHTNDSRFDYLVPLNINIEPRWYFNMGKHIKKGKRASNFTGTYLGLEVGHRIFRNVDANDSVSVALYSRSIRLNMGLQLRIFKNGYINYKIFNGFENTDPKHNKQWSWQYGSAFALGLAFGKGGVDSKQRYCEAFKCHLEEKQLFKINLLRTLPSIGENSFQTYIGFGYERKLFGSPFSINTESYFRYSYSHSKSEISESTSSHLASTFTFEPRYYYNLKKRIAKGNAANNLSGTYIGLLHQFIVIWGENTRITQGTRRYIRIIHSQLVAAPVWGLQYRIFKNGYFDYKVGFGIHALGDLEAKKLFNQYQVFNWEFLTELKVGLAF